VVNLVGFKHTSANGLSGGGDSLKYQVGEVSLTGSTGTVAVISSIFESPVIKLTGIPTGNVTLTVAAGVGSVFKFNNQTTGKKVSVQIGAGPVIELRAGLNEIVVDTVANPGMSPGRMLALALSDANTTLTNVQVHGVTYFSFTGTLTAGRDVTFPNSNLGMFVVKNGTGQTLTLKVGSGSYALTTATTKMLFGGVDSLEALN
jgi:hypothetical protein